MKIKTTSFFICLILITSATCVPVFSSSNIVKKDNITKDELSSDKTKDIFSKNINDLANGNIDLKDLNQLYSNPYIKQNIKNLSNKETINLLDSIFKSENYNKIKFLSYKLASKISEKINDDLFSLYDTFFDEFFSEIKSVDNLKDSEYLSELNLEIEDIYQMKTDWELYISDKTDFKNIIKNLDIDGETLFLIVFVLWVFINGAIAISFPEVFPIAIMLIESVAFGLTGSILTGIIFDSDDHPLLEGIYNFLNNSKILKKIPIVRNMSLTLVNLTIGIIESRIAMIISVVGWTFSTIALATFLYLFSNVVIIKLVASGIWFIFPYIVWKIIELIEDSDGNTIKTSLFCPNLMN